MSAKRHTMADLVPSVVGPISDLVPHPQNYKEHPEEQVQHLMASMEQFGQTRNIVVARDGTILAGHGVVEAAFRLDWDTIEWKQLDLASDSPEAVKLLALDNEIGRFAITDDRRLTELLRYVHQDATAGLLGTGYDEMILANLVMVTRTAAEVGDRNAAAEWVGMPDYTPEGQVWKLVVQFTSEADRQQFMDQLDLGNVVAFSKFSPHAIAGWWPRPQEVRHDGGLTWEPEDAPAQ